MSNPLLSVRNVGKNFGAARVLENISLEIGDGEFLTLLGESGSGKTTLLRIIAGFETADAGEIWMSGQRLDTQPPDRRNVNTVFQHYALFPHLSVFENVAYGPRAKRTPAAEIDSRVRAALLQVKMDSFSQRRPAQLSGGQQQRIALARALVNRPAVLLLDEPLSALDANLRRQMQVELKTLQREVGITFVFVTHDQQEAMTLSDRIALLRNGRIEQIDSPKALYSQPRTAYTASFVGETNLIRGMAKDGRVRAARLEWTSALPDGESFFSLRPEQIHLADLEPANPGKLRIEGTVRKQVFAGPNVLLEVLCAGEITLLVRVSNRDQRLGDVVLEIAPEDLLPVRE